MRRARHEAALYYSYGISTLSSTMRRTHHETAYCFTHTADSLTQILTVQRSSYSSVMYSIRRYHLQCICHEAARAASSALSSAAALLERYFFTWYLLPALYTYQDSQAGKVYCISQAGKLHWFSQPAFLIGDFHQASFICCFESSLISPGFSLSSSCSTYGSSQLLTIVAESPSLDQLISVDD